MWTVLKKELREGWLFLLVNTVWLLGVPPIGQLLWPRHWDADVTSIFYAIMFGVFIPLYLVILAAGLVQDENTFLVRGLPVKPWKVAGGKLLYLLLNLLFLELLCLPLFSGNLSLPDWVKSDLPYLLLWWGGTGLAALAGFAFAAFLPRKSYAIFTALLATILSMGSLIYLTSIYSEAVFSDLSIHLFLAAALILLLAGSFIVYHDLILQSRRRWVRALAVALLLPIVAGALWLRAPLWLKQTVVGNPYYLSPAADGLFITARMGHRQENYLFDAGTGDLRSIPFIGDAEYIAGTDPDRNTVYTATVKTFESKGDVRPKSQPAKPKDERRLRKYSALDPITGKTRDLGLLPGHYVAFEGDIARWGRSEDKNRLFGFKNLVHGTAFEFNDPGCRYTAWGKDGVLFDTPGPDGPVWKFADFATAQVKEAFRGEYYPWPGSVQGGYFLFEGSRDYSKGIPCDRTCYRWDPATGALQKLGPGRPILAQDDMVILIRGEEDKSKTLVFFRDGREISTLPTKFLGGYPVEWSRFDSVIRRSSPWRFVFHSDESRGSKVLGVLTVEGDRINLKTVPFPASMIDLLPIPGSQDLLLFVKNKKDMPDWDDSLRKVYRMDPATGKMRRLV